MESPRRMPANVEPDGLGRVKDTRSSRRLAPVLFAGAIALPASIVVLAGSEPAQAGRPLRADGFQWVRSLKGPVSGDSGDDMVVDEDGTMFIAGTHGGLDIDNDGSVDLVAGSIDPLFVKLGPEGEVLWIRSATGPKFDSFTRIALDRAGGAYAVGSFRETLTFQRGPRLHGLGETEGYLVRFDGVGNALWARALTGEHYDGIRDVASDAAGNAYIVAWSRGSFTLDGHPERFRTRGDAASIIASYDPDGELRWIRTGTSTASWQVSRIEVSPDGEVVAVGVYGPGPVEFDDGARVDLPEVDRQTVFVATLGRDGNVRRAWPIIAEQGRVSVTGIDFAPDGGLVLAGSFGPPVDFDNDGGFDVRTLDEGRVSGFLAVHHPDGRLRWARPFALDGVWHVTAGAGRYVLSGFYRSGRDLDRDGSPEPTANDEKRDSETGILVVSGDGRLQRVFTAAGPGNDQARAAVFQPDRPVLFVTGFVQLTADFSGDGRFEEGGVLCDALGDFIIARYDLADCALTLHGDPRRDGNVKLPHLTWSGASSATVEIHRDGRLIATTANDGVYTDTIAPGIPGPFRYRILEAGSTSCSATVTVDF